MALEPRSSNKPLHARRQRAITVSPQGRTAAVSSDSVRSVIFALTKDANLWEGSLNTALSRLLESSLSTLGCEVASIWQLGISEQELCCIAQRETGIGNVDPSGEFKRVDCERFFKRMLTARITAVEDCYEDGRTNELVDSYYRQHDIRALMVAGFRRKGRAQGIVCFEQLGRTRAWSGAEQEFAIAIAELINQVLLMAELRRQNQLLAWLNSMAGEFSQARPADELAGIGVERLARYFHDIWVGFYKVNPRRDGAELIATGGVHLPDFARHALHHVDLKDPLYAGVLEQSEMIVVPDCDAVADQLPQPQGHIVVAAGIKSLMLVPLIDGGETLAFLKMATFERLANRQSEFGNINSVAVTFGIAYAHALRQERVEHSVFQDSLTGLKNRDQFDHDLQCLDREASHLLVMMDFHDFQKVNETLGRSRGDLVLTELAGLLKTFVEQEVRGHAYRMSGARFCLLFRDVDNLVETLPGSLQTWLNSPLDVEGIKIVMAPNLGVAGLPAKARNRSQLMKHAELALGWSRHSAEGLVWYDPCRDTLGPGNLELLADLKACLESDGLQLCYQPTFDLQSGKLMSCEALARWEHPEHGFIPPERFVVIAESGDLIKPLTMWVARQAVSQVSLFEGLDIQVPIAINVTAVDLVDSGFPVQLGLLMEEFGVVGGNIRLEVTESALMSDPERSQPVIEHLSDLGVRLDINGFGTGYSSISALGHLPLNTIKIHRSFLAELPTSELNQSSIRSMIGLAQGMGVPVVAEGVEDAATLELLKQLGCDGGQGYYFSKPVPATEFIANRDSWTSRS